MLETKGELHTDQRVNQTMKTINLYKPNKRVSKYMKQKWIDSRRIYANQIIVRNFSISCQNGKSWKRWKFRRNIHLKNTIDQWDITHDKHSTQYCKWTFVFKWSWKFTNMEHIFSRRNKFSFIYFEILKKKKKKHSSKHIPWV